MKDTFFYTLHAILPILLIVTTGYVMRRVGPWDDGFYKKVNQLCFRLFLPIQLFCNVYAVKDLRTLNGRVLAFIALSILFSAAVGVLTAMFAVKDRNQKGVIAQATFRSNTAVLGTSLVASLVGESALGFYAVVAAISIPLFNSLAVIVLVLFSGDPDRKPTVRSVLKKIITNPLIVGVLCGVAAVLIRQFIPAVDGTPIFTIKNNLPDIYSALSKMSVIASPMMIFVLGARLDFNAVKGNLSQLLLGVLMRNILCPTVVISIAVALRNFLNLTPECVASMLSVLVTPVAVSTTVMVQEIGGDDQLAGQIVVWSSVLSMLTIFCFVYVLRSFGLL